MSTTPDLTFPLLGRALHVHGMPALHDWLRAQWNFTEHDRPYHPHVIRIEPAAVLPPLHDPAVHVARVPGFELTWQQHGDVWHNDTGGSGTRLTLRPSESIISLAYDSARPSGPRLAALYTVIVEAVRASGLVPLHAAAIARDDRVTLFLGPSGVGKTTSLLRAVNHGWAPVAEDLVWIDPETFRIFGWDRGVRLWPGTEDGLVPIETWDTAPDGKLFLPWARLPVDRCHAGQLDRILVLDRSDNAVDTRVPPSDAVRVLWEATGIALSDSARARTADCVRSFVRDVTIRYLPIGGRELRL